jgi:hypothetical protein
MSIDESFQRDVEGHGRASGQLAQRMPCGVWVALAIGFCVAVEYGLSLALEPPGEAIRAELQAAGAELHSQLFVEPTPAMRAAVRRHFGDRDVDVDLSSRWPNVAATLHNVDWEACANAVLEARRIEDPVVIDLESYRSPRDCRDRNDMKWWIRP